MAACSIRRAGPLTLKAQKHTNRSKSARSRPTRPSAVAGRRRRTRHAFAGNGGDGGGADNGGAGGGAAAAKGVPAAPAALAEGGGLYDAGIVSFTGVTINFENEVRGGNRRSMAAEGRDSGRQWRQRSGRRNWRQCHRWKWWERRRERYRPRGAASLVDLSGNLTLNPRLGARKGSKQAKATDLITANQAFDRLARRARRGTRPSAGGTPILVRGRRHPGQNGSIDTFAVGAGGGIANVGTATIDNTTISGNSASTSNDDVLGPINT